jgi:hypothetical protein
LFSPRYSTSTIGLPSWSMTLNGHDSISFFTVGSSNRRPINRLQPRISTNPQRREKSKNDKDLLDIEDGVSWVHGSLVLCGFTDQTLLVGERDEARSGKTSLLVGNDFHIGSLIVGNYSISVSAQMLLICRGDKVGLKNVPQEYVVPIEQKIVSFCG